MISRDFERRLADVRSNVFVNPEIVDRIRNEVVAGSLTEGQATKQLTALERSLSQAPLQFTSQQIQDEWAGLTKLLESSETRWNKIASNQFLVGLAALPLAVALIFGSLFFGWQHEDGATTVAGILAGCLAAVAAHSFLVFRIHQQAGLAAERLSEKRVGALFLRLASSRADPEESRRLLEAGTAMFLGHYVAETLPLKGDDFSPTKP